jgi:predicted RNA-binding protein associated with RNAse of E/G family
MRNHIVVRKLDTRGQVVTSYAAIVAERFADGVLLDARWERSALALGYTTFETGDRFREWFYSDRWYNIFEVATSAGALKGWYCNVAEPAIMTETEIRCRDLLLDLWVAPGGETLILDEEEFAADSALDAPTRERALTALAELRRLVATRTPPFDKIALPGSKES